MELTSFLFANAVTTDPLENVEDADEQAALGNWTMLKRLKILPFLVLVLVKFFENISLKFKEVRNNNTKNFILTEVDMLSSWPVNCE